MIFWFTGQPGAGKSTLARALAATLRKRGHEIAEIDGESLRFQTGNSDFSEAGRIANVKAGQLLAAELAGHGKVVVAAFVSPHRWVREEFKARHDVLEIYVHSASSVAKSAFRVPYYEPPLANYVDLDTSALDVKQSLEKVFAACPAFVSRES